MKKIKFIEVEFRNFLSYGNTWQKFVFNNGLNIIQGHIVESDKSNGSGKSSLTELIPFALFGKTIKKINKAKIVNWYNEKNCEVRLKLSVGDTLYEIRRGIKPNKAELWVNGTCQPKAAHVTDFQSQIEDDIIGMDFQTFQNLIYFSPNNTISIINAGKPEKRKFLESLFDLSIYSSMLKTVNGKLTVNEKKRDKLETEQTAYGNELQRLIEEISNTAIPNIRKYRDTVKGLDFQLEELKKKEFSVHEDDIKIEEEFLQRSKDILSEWEKKLSDSESKITLHQTIIDKIGDLEEVKNKRKAIESEIESLESKDLCKLSEEDLVDDLQAKDFMKDEIRNIVTEIQELDKDFAVSDANLSRTRDQLEGSDDKSGQRCMACHQTITKEHIDKHKKELQKYEQECIKECRLIQDKKSELNKDKDELYSQVKDESERLKGLLQDIKDTVEVRKSIEQYRQRLDDLPDSEGEEATITENKEMIESEKKGISEYISKIHLCEIDIELSEGRLEKLQKKQSEKEEHDRTVKTIEQQFKTASDHYQDMIAINKKLEKELVKKKEHQKELETTIEDNISDISKLNSLADYLNYVKVSLKDENVKRFAISSLIPYLNTQTNYYLSESGFPYVVSVDSWLDVSIRGLGVSDVSYGSLSGGETKCIDLSIQLACNDIASMMAKTSFDIMILDEVLDSSVDSLGVQALLDIIRVRQKANNDSVYVITHRNEIDLFTFDSVVRIIQEDKFSKVTVE